MRVSGTQEGRVGEVYFCPYEVITSMETKANEDVLKGFRYDRWIDAYLDITLDI